MKYTGVVISTKEPNKDALWIKEGKLHYFNNGEWTELTNGAGGSNGAGNSNDIPIIDHGSVKSIDVYPNTYNIVDLTGFEPDSEDSYIILNINLMPEQEGFVNEYMIEVTTGSHSAYPEFTGGNPDIFEGYIHCKSGIFTIDENSVTQLSIIRNQLILSSVSVSHG